MNPLRYISLLQKKRNEALSDTEQEALQSWLGDKENRQLADEVDQLWQVGEQYQSTYEPDVEAGLQRFKARIQAEAEITTPAGAKRKTMRSSMWRVAAALLLLLGLSVVYRVVLRPDASSAIVLTNTTSTPQAHTLPDGSTVYLNANTTLTYAADIQKQSIRTVQLDGEAFFEVAADKTHPFHVMTEHVRVEVVGTAFNLRAIPGESFTEVEVEEGVVHFFATKIRQRTEHLKAKEKATVFHGNRLERTRVKALNARSWQTGRLNFRKVPVATVLKMVERHYGINIDASKSKILQCTFNTNFNEASIDEVLENFRLILNVQVKKVDAQQYQLIGGGC